MGLGKTLSMISLLASDYASCSSQFTRTKPTLLVVPLSLLSTWETELDIHLWPATLQSQKYHGPQRSEMAELMLRNDVVITTYDVVALEWQRLDRHSSPLFSTEWHRVVLDEGEHASILGYTQY